MRTLPPLIKCFFPGSASLRLFNSSISSLCEARSSKDLSGHTKNHINLYHFDVVSRTKLYGFRGTVRIYTLIYYYLYCTLYLYIKAHATAHWAFSEKLQKFTKKINMLWCWIFPKKCGRPGSRQASLISSVHRVEKLRAFPRARVPHTRRAMRSLARGVWKFGHVDKGEG